MKCCQWNMGHSGLEIKRHCVFGTTYCRVLLYVLHLTRKEVIFMWCSPRLTLSHCWETIATPLFSRIYVETYLMKGWRMTECCEWIIPRSDDEQQIVNCIVQNLSSISDLFIYNLQTITGFLTTPQAQHRLHGDSQCKWKGRLTEITM